MKTQKLKNGVALFLGIYVLLSIVFFWIARDQLCFHDETTTMVTLYEPIGELVQGMELNQPFTAEGNELRSVSIMLSTYERTNSCKLLVQVTDMAGQILGQIEIAGQDIENNVVRDITFSEPVQLIPGKTYALVLRSPDGTPGNAITAWWGNSISTSHTQVPLNLSQEKILRVNGEAISGILAYSMEMREYLWFGQVYWYIVGILGVLLLAYGVYLVYAAQKERSTLLLRLLSAFDRYNYLIRQLVSRDFKTKYKRSVLGILWSFLNPLLTMMVQYIVFSTLFKSDIPNFPLYLLTGIVCYNFFNEASSMALTSIVGNASLITKVYVPKYIYPISRVLSSGINLLLSMIPLFAVMLLTGTPFRPALLLLPFGLICLMAFSIGVGFVLSTAMVFFRDTQFLWGVVSMLWMYATPIVYPESIIGEQYVLLFKCNPLYHIIRFIRIVLIDGISPEPKAYLLCLIASVVPMLVGAIVFKKNQDKFILNL